MGCSRGMELVYSSSRLYAGSFFTKLYRSINNGFKEGVLLCFSSQGDEAQKRLRVNATRSITGHPALVDRPSGSGPTPKFKGGGDACNAKVLYNELRVSVLLRDTRTKALESITFDLPCGLQNVSRTTAECLVPANRALYEIHGLTPAVEHCFKQVYIPHTQDRAGGNERQIYVARQEELNPPDGIKKRVRLAMACEVHGLVRCMTSQLDLVYNVVSGMIAFSISSQGPFRGEELHNCIAKRALRILRIDRTVIVSK